MRRRASTRAGLRGATSCCAVEDSLRRLQTDRIDVYFVHRFDPDTPWKRPLRALDDAGAAGQDPLSRGQQLGGLADRQGAGHLRAAGWAPFACLQPMYNLTKRQAEVELLPLALAREAGRDSLQPAGRRPADRQVRHGARRAGRLVENAVYMQALRRRRLHFEVANASPPMPRTWRHPAALAVAWVMAHPAVTAPIIGARSLEQLEASLARRRPR